MHGDRAAPDLATTSKADATPWDRSPARWRTVLEEDRRFERLLISVLAFLSICKGLGKPLAWAYTQAQVDYSEGFVRRGLFGATFGKALKLQHVVRFDTFAFVLLAIALVLLGGALRRSRLDEVFPRGHVGALVASSFALTFFVHTVGYFDVLLFSLAAGLVLMPHPVTRGALGVPLLGLGLLIHENFLLLFVPVVLLSFLLERRAEGTQASASTWRSALGLAVGVVAFAAWVARRGTVSSELAAKLERHVIAQTDGTLNLGFFGVLTTSTTDSLRILLRFYKDPYAWSHILLPCVVLFAPTLWCLHYLNLRLVRTFSPNRGTALVCVAAGLSPLLLFFLGVDVARWLADATFATVLVLYLVCRRAGFPHLPVSKAMRHGVLLLIICNVAAGDQLMSGVRIHVYPFTELVGSIARAVHKHA